MLHVHQIELGKISAIPPDKHLDGVLFFSGMKKMLADSTKPLELKLIQIRKEYLRRTPVLTVLSPDQTTQLSKSKTTAVQSAGRRGGGEPCGAAPQEQPAAEGRRPVERGEACLGERGPEVGRVVCSTPEAGATERRGRWPAANRCTKK